MDKLLAIKFLGPNNCGPTKNKCKYDVSGAWNSLTARKQAIRTCSFGYHAALLEGIEYYLSSYTRLQLVNSCWLVELSGKIDYNITWGNEAKVAAEKIRFIKEIKISKEPYKALAHILAIAHKFNVCSILDMVNIPKVRGIRRWDAE